MKQYIRHFFCLTIAMVMAMPNLVAQVDLQKSFYVMHNDSTGVTGKLEGGEWLIRFSDVDSLGNQFSNPVAMNIEAAYYGDTTYIEMQTVDSVLFEVPEDEMKPGVFELTEDHFKYIIGSDSATTIRFRIDCLTKIDLPKVGQKVLCNIFRDYLPYGFIGQVESMKASYDLGYIELKCKQIPLREVYSKYYKTGFTGSDSLNAEAKRRGGFVAPQRFLDPIERTANSGVNEAFDKNLDLEFYMAWIETNNATDFRFSNSVSSLENALDKKYGSDWRRKQLLRANMKLNGGIGCYYTTIIDADNEENFTAVWFETSFNANLSPLLTINTPFKSTYEQKFVEFPIPIPVPGLVLTAEFGGKYSFNASASVGLDFSVNMSKSLVGLRLDGVNSAPIFDVPQPKNPGGLGWNADARLLLSGNAFLGFYLKFGIAIYGDVAEIDAGLSVGATVDASIDALIDSSENLDASWQNINYSNERYGEMLRSSTLKVGVGIYPEGSISLAADYISVDLVKALNDILGINLKFLELPIYNLTSYPKLVNPRFTKNTDDRYLFQFGKEKSFFGGNIGCFLKDVSGSADDSSIPLTATGMEYCDGGENRVAFDVDIEPNFRGKTVRAYPYLQATFLSAPFTEYYIPDVYVDKYIPVLFNVKDMEPMYDNLDVVCDVVDFEALEDVEQLVPYCNIYNASKKIENSVELPKLEEQLSLQLGPEELEGVNEGYITFSLVDKDDNDEKTESRFVPFKILDIYEPKTLDYENVTTTGATVWAELHEVLVDQIKKGQVTDVEVGFHIQKYTGESSDVWTNAITIPFTDTRYCYQFVDLEPGQGYQYYAAVRKNKDVIYRGETKSFTTLPVIQGLDVTNIGPSRAYLLAEIAKSEDFKTTSVMFQFSEDETFKTTIDVTTEGSDWDFDSETDYYPVSKECDGLAPETEYYYRLAWVRNGEERLRYSEAKTFTTEPPLKNLTHSALGSTRMVIAADIAKIFEDRHFELQLSTNKEDWPYYKYTVEKEESDSPDYNSFTFDIKDLKSQKKYYYRFRCWLGSKEYYSDIMSFTMPKPDLSPTVADVKVTGNSVKIGASIPQDLHDREPDHMYFVVATKKDYSTSDNSTLMVTVPFEKGKLKYEAEFSGLQYDKTYYCTFVAGTIVEEWGRADMKSFKTDKNPADTQSCITLDPVVQSDTVTFVGKINDATTLSLFRSAEYPNSAVGFELFKGEGLTNAESDYIVFEVDKTTGEFRSEGNRLQPETTYTYRAFVNLTGDKRVYSENSITFKTARYDGDLVIPDAKKRQGDLEK